jgi:hypothetical protein
MAPIPNMQRSWLALAFLCAHVRLAAAQSSSTAITEISPSTVDAAADQSIVLTVRR